VCNVLAGSRKSFQTRRFFALDLPVICLRNRKQHKMLVTFTNFTLDLDRRELKGAAGPIHVEPQVFDLLLYLARNSNRVIGKDELIEHVWKGRVVSDAALNSRINAARRAIGESGEKQVLIRTVPRHGFLFAANVSIQIPDQAPSSATVATSTEGADLKLPDKPSIAVLPFQNLSGDPERDYFCDGLVEDIITTLSKLTGLQVVARHSSFVYRGRSVDVRDVAKQLGVRYVLEGSVQKSGNRIRITVQLIDATDGTHVWAERYDRAVDDIFTIQDEITLVLATEMQVKLTEGEQARLRYTTTNNVEAWRHWVQGLSHFRQPVTKEKFGPARVCWEKALALDPDSAALNAMLGFMHYVDARFNWWDDRETALNKASAYADRALQLDPDNADAYTTSSLVLLLRGRYDQAVVDARKAVQLAPSSADVATFACFVLASSGIPEEALVQIEKAMALNPNYPANYLGHLGNACRLSGRLDQAIAAFKAYDARNAGFGLTDLVITYQQIGQPEQAKQTAERLLTVRRDFTISSWMKTQFRRDTARFEADVAALRTAGLPMR
jgi:adenylate cyclase